MAESEAEHDKPYVAGAEAHQRLEWLSGHPVAVLFDAASTRGQLMVLESTPPAGSASPMHVHGNEDEMFIFLDEAGIVRVGEERHELHKGGVAFLPRHVPHGYRITEDAHVLTLCTPAGLEEFFRTAGHDLSKPKPDGWAITPASLTAALTPLGGRILGPAPD